MLINFNEFVLIFVCGNEQISHLCGEVTNDTQTYVTVQHETDLNAFSAFSLLQAHFRTSNICCSFTSL